MSRESGKAIAATSTTTEKDVSELRSQSMTPQPPSGVGSRPTEQDIYEVAERVAAGQADNADAATLLTALTAERAALLADVPLRA